MILAVITTYRRKPQMLERAIKSVVAQTYTDWDLVVVDDSQPDYELRDEVRRMVEGYSLNDNRIKYLPHDRNYGRSYARNTAMNFAVNSPVNYGFIAYLDDDDEWLPEYLQRQLEKLVQCGENYGLVYCGFYMCDDLQGTSREIKKSFAGDNVRDELMRHNAVGSPSCVVMRLKCLVEVQGFDVELDCGEDWDAWAKITRKYDAVYLDMPLVNYHIIHNQRGTQDKEHEKAELRKRIREAVHVLEKDKDYYAQNKYAHWIRISELAVNYRKNGEFGKSFASLIKSVSLQPFRLIGNLRVFYRLIIPYAFFDHDKTRAALQRVVPESLYWKLSSIYRKIMRKFF